MSTNATFPAFTCARSAGLLWYGARHATASASASVSSSARPVEAPASTRMRYGSPRACAARARAASARGTALAEPAGVNPLKPTRAPSGIRAAASSAVNVGNGAWAIRGCYGRRAAGPAPATPAAATSADRPSTSAGAGATPSDTAPSPRAPPAPPAPPGRRRPTRVRAALRGPAPRRAAPRRRPGLASRSPRPRPAFRGEPASGRRPSAWARRPVRRRTDPWDTVDASRRSYP